MYDEIVSPHSPSFTRGLLKLIWNNRPSMQALTTNYYAHSVSSIDESWLEGIPGFSEKEDVSMMPTAGATGKIGKSNGETNDNVDMSE